MGSTKAEVAQTKPFACGPYDDSPRRQLATEKRWKEKNTQRSLFKMEERQLIFTLGGCCVYCYRRKALRRSLFYDSQCRRRKSRQHRQNRIDPTARRRNATAGFLSSYLATQSEYVFITLHAAADRVIKSSAAQSRSIDKQETCISFFAAPLYIRPAAAVPSRIKNLPTTTFF